MWLSPGADLVTDWAIATNERVGFLNQTILSFAENVIQTKLR